MMIAAMIPMFAPVAGLCGRLFRSRYISVAMNVASADDVDINILVVNFISKISGDVR